MKSKKLKIVHISSEVEPFSKSGGLASITSSLPKIQEELGYDVTIITPFYEGIVSKDDLIEESEMEIVSKEENYESKILRGKIGNDIPVFFVSSKKFFSKKHGLYGSDIDNSRFFFFDLAALDLIKKLGKAPDIIHCHDWQSGLIPYFLKGRYKTDDFWKNTATLFTIHNLVYQLGHDWWKISPKKKDDGHSILPLLKQTKKVENINFAKRAILNADTINTVSETYREEILTKDFGEDLHRILKNREDRVFGIVNGIDYKEYNPATDPGLFANYDHNSTERKSQNKEWLQKKFKLKIDPKIPVICMTSRIAEQKGFEIFLEALQDFLKQEIQFIIMGDGDKEITKILEKLQKKYPQKIVVTPFDAKYETSLYAGSDIFLLPSRFEPCGINQLIALRYGCIPVVHYIGGLADTITNFQPTKKIGNGFVFKDYSSIALTIALTRAVENYKYHDVWKSLTISALKEANSWKIPTEKYIDLYKKTIKFKKQNGHSNNY